MTNINFEQYRNFINEINPSDNCPIQALISILSKKWNLRIIFELTKKDSIRFSELKSQIENITNASLSSTLKELEKWICRSNTI